MNAQLIPLTEAVVLRGQRAWTRIKATAAEQRQAWREIGEALRYGRALHRSNQAFGAWCAAQGFDMKPQVRSDAMWLAESWSVLQSLEDGDSHPTNIRAAYREAPPPPTPELTIETPSRLTASIEVVAPIAAKVNKLVSMAERGEAGRTWCSPSKGASRA